jgi:hypothetical protein
MKRRRWVLPVVVVAIVVLVVVGVPSGFLLVFQHPWDTVPSKADLVGVWQDGNSNKRIVFYSSGKTTFYNIPKGVVDWTGYNSAGKTPPETISGTWDSFYREGPIGPEGSYTVPTDGGTIGALWSNGNDVTGRQLVMNFGDDQQFEYDFHRVSTNP